MGNVSKPMNLKTDLRTADNLYEENPFIIEVGNSILCQRNRNTFIVQGKDVFNAKTGEVIPGEKLMYNRKVVDRREFVQYYVSAIGMGLELSHRGKALLMYIINNIDYENKVYINAAHRKCCESIGYKAATLRLAIKELLEHDVIARTYGDCYWVNPSILCKGRRYRMLIEVASDDAAAYDGEWQDSQQLPPHGMQEIL